MKWFKLSISFFMVINCFYLNALTPDKVTTMYSLMIKAIDQDGITRVAILPGKSLIGNEDNIIDVPRGYFMYDENSWNAVCAMWEDTKKPEDMGCCAITANGEITRRSIIKCAMPIRFYQEAPEKTTLSFIFDLGLTFQEAFLVLNDFVDECGLVKHKGFILQKNPPTPLSFDIFNVEFDQEDIEKFQQEEPPSTLTIYARQIGVALLLQYYSIKYFLMESMNSAKGILSGKK